MAKLLKLTDSLIGINKLGTYHGWMNPDNYFDSYQIDQDFEEGHIDFDSEKFWELFSWDLYTDKIVSQIDGLTSDLTFELNLFLRDYSKDLDVIERINCVGIDSPKYYNYRDDHYLLDFVVNQGRFKKALIKFAKSNKEEFSLFLKDNYSSRSGFISFTANNYLQWLDEFSRLDETAIGAVLSYLINCHLQFDFCEHCLQNFEIYYSDCIESENL